MKGIYVILIFLLSTTIFGYINIYPIEFDKDISNGVTERFKLYNRTDNEVKYRIYIEKSKEKDMSQWIEVYPQSISLKPLEEKELRLSVTPESNAQPGEYKAKLVIKEVVVPNKKDSKKIKMMTLFKLNMKGCIEEKNGLNK